MTPQDILRDGQCGDTFDYAKMLEMKDEYGKARCKEMPKHVSLQRIQDEMSEIDRQRQEQEAATVRAQEGAEAAAAEGAGEKAEAVAAAASTRIVSSSRLRRNLSNPSDMPPPKLAKQRKAKAEAAPARLEVMATGLPCQPFRQQRVEVSDTESMQSGLSCRSGRPSSLVISHGFGASKRLTVLDVGVILKGYKPGRELAGARDRARQATEEGRVKVAEALNTSVECSGAAVLWGSHMAKSTTADLTAGWVLLESEGHACDFLTE